MGLIKSNYCMSSIILHKRQCPKRMIDTSRKKKRKEKKTMALFGWRSGKMGGWKIMGGWKSGRMENI